jgi:hypothetical protein
MDLQFKPGVDFGFQLPLLTVPAILAILVALCLHLSATSQPGIELLLQTKTNVPFNRAVTGRSKLLNRLFLAGFSPQLNRYFRLPDKC